ncbi:MAG: hypothetical protein A2138_25050 [Deltaproteobacteria bacterium RBG_16_71_12]|nr:MAG: hypothetical protein A2138_25050 [Deltaproteobacteria bacterium RBG_16_71_12]
MSLAAVVQRCRAAASPAGPSPVVVFDLDGTLFDNGPRTWQILVDFAEATGNTSLRGALDALPRTGLPYLLRDVLSRCGHTDERLAADAHAFWKQRFFTNEFQRFDEPVHGAVRFVRALFDAGATVAYLSGRDAPNMLVGCAAALRRHRFPIGIPRTAIVLKHAYEDTDLDFKRQAVAFVGTLGAVAATFDNEPAMCNLFAERWPAAAHYFVHTTHAPDPPPLHAGVVTVPDLRHE